MKHFALTITRNKKVSVEDTVDSMKEDILKLINALHANKYESGHLGWEFQKEGNKYFHVHTTIVGSKMPYFKHKDYKQIIKDNYLNVRCDCLKDDKDKERWTSYIHKEDNILQFFNSSTRGGEAAGGVPDLSILNIINGYAGGA